MLRSVTVKVLEAALVVLMLLPAVWTLQTFINGAPCKKGNSGPLGGWRFVRKVFLKRRTKPFTAPIVTDATARGNKFS